jgi:hypothetical protein
MWASIAISVEDTLAEGGVTATGFGKGPDRIKWSSDFSMEMAVTEVEQVAWILQREGEGIELQGAGPPVHFLAVLTVLAIKWSLQQARKQFDWKLSTFLSTESHDHVIMGPNKSK